MGAEDEGGVALEDAEGDLRAEEGLREEEGGETGAGDEDWFLGLGLGGHFCLISIVLRGWGWNGVTGCLIDGCLEKRGEKWGLYRAGSWAKVQVEAHWC